MSTVTVGVTSVSPRVSPHRTTRGTTRQCVVKVLERSCAGSEVELLLDVSPAGTSHGCGPLRVLKQQQEAIAQTSDILFPDSEARDSIDDALVHSTSG